MTILITGANGFVGYYITSTLLKKGYHVVATGKGVCRLPGLPAGNFSYVELDITDPFQMHDVFEKYKPAVVVHAAAMSKPDDCELRQSVAYVTNVEATVQLLLNAEDHHCHFIFISTDFVFDGVKGMYAEDDLPSPVNYYGRTKLEAEEAVKEYPFDWSIVRTVLVYGRTLEQGKNLLSIVKEKLEKGEVYSVVDDQQRTPTYVEDLTGAIISIIEKQATGIFHISGDELMTPYAMACKTADHLGLDQSLLKKVTADSFSQPATRPLKTGFNIAKARKELGYQPISFQQGLIRTFE